MPPHRRANERSVGPSRPAQTPAGGAGPRPAARGHGGARLLTVNLLHALPRTPLWDRLEADGRLLADPGERESNVQFLRPHDDVVADWRQAVE